MLGLKLIHVSKMDPRQLIWSAMWYHAPISQMDYELIIQVFTVFLYVKWCLQAYLGHFVFEIALGWMAIVNIDSGNGLVSLLSDPMFTNICQHMASVQVNESIYIVPYWQ